MQEKRICKECGKEFIATNGMQMFCKNDHYRMCVICGKEFLLPKSVLGAKDARVTCSKKCSAELRRRTNIDKYGGPAPASSKDIQDKMEATMEKRYGVKHAAQSEQFLSKMRATSKERYGVDYYVQTDDCKQQMVNNWKDHHDERLAKFEATCIERYGVKNVLASEELREKYYKEYQERTGYAHPMQNPEVFNKMIETNLSRYGVKHPLQSKEIQDKMKAQWIDKYGVDNPMKLQQFHDKAANTTEERYGVRNIMQSSEFQARFRKTMQERYGVNYFSESADWKLARMTDPSKIDKFLQFSKDPKSYIDANYEERPTLMQVCQDLGVGTEAISLRLNRFNCRDAVKYYYSKMEEAVYDKLKSFCRIERNSHSVITPYELDLYLPEYNVGIECNPTSTHNSSVNVFSSTEPPTSPSYHRMKTELCEERGVFLFHIFGYEWTHKQEIIISMLKNLISANDQKIYARKCEIKEVSSVESSKFLNKNHRQGAAGSSIRLGLYYQDELVSLMTFGKMRKTIGTSDKEDLTDCWELVRFCNKLNTTVVGGASKLFKHFVSTYQPIRIRSFSDRAHTKGTLYQTLRFTEIRRSDQGYVWVDAFNDKAYNRYNAQKHHIKQFLHDDNIDLSKSEKQIMEEHEFLQVFDSGTITWEWSR